MGGRRARSVAEIAGPGLTHLATRLGHALERGDPGAITASAATLVAQGKKTIDLIYYGSKLLDFVEKTIKTRGSLERAERERLVRQEWSRIKKAEGLPDDPITTDAIVNAAVRALGKPDR
jgi:hypothetical protein